MKKEYIDISFFKKAILPKDPKHKISFNNVNDIYNPFNKYNFIFNLKIAKNECISFIESIYKILILNELNESINGSFFKKMISQADTCMHEHMSTILSSIILKKSKVLMKQIQSPWAHMLVSFMLDDVMQMILLYSTISISWYNSQAILTWMTVENISLKKCK